MAFLLATGATYALYQLLRRHSRQLATRPIVVAAHALPAGVALAPADLRLADWPASLPLASSFASIAKVTGRPLLYPLPAGEPVLQPNLALPGAGIGLSGRIPPGMRATSVRSNRVVGVAGFLYPGSHVDVLVTFSNTPGQSGPVTQTVLQDAEVLTAGEQVEPDPEGKPHTVDVVTLLLKPEEAQRLLMASTVGTIQFVMRNGTDNRRWTSLPTRLTQLIGAPLVPGRGPATARRRGRDPAGAAAVTIDVIQGAKHSRITF